MSIIRLNFSDNRKIILKRTIFKLCYWLVFKINKNKVWVFKSKFGSEKFYCLAKIQKITKKIVEMQVVYA